MKNKSGFTLIELMVVVLIGIMVTGGALALFNDFNEKQKIEAVRQELLANLRMARTFAVTEQFPSNIGDDNKNTDDKVVMALVVDNNNKTIQIRARDVYGFNQEIPPTKTIPNSMTISIGTGNSVAFSISDGRSIGGTAVIEIKGDDGTSKKIKIEESGVINEQ